MNELYMGGIFLKIYSVQKGDTVETIAEKHGISRSDLRKLNAGLSEKEVLTPGLKVKIPTESKPVQRKIVVVKKTEEKEKATEVQPDAPFQEEDPEVNISLNSNTYTFKTENVQAPTMPHNDGYVEQTMGIGMEGEGVPMMEDPFPNAMMHKDEQDIPEQATPGYGLPSGGGYGQPHPGGSNYPVQGYNYNYPYQPQMPNAYPQAGQAYPQAGAPYTQNGEPNYPNPAQEEQQGYYGYPSGWSPYRNPLGCQVDDPYYEANRNYYENVPYPATGQIAYTESEQNPLDQGPNYYNYFGQDGGMDQPQVDNQPAYGYPNTPNATYPAYYNPNESGQYSPQQGYPGAYNQAPYYTNPPQNPAAPDYSMWESYVDYHEPPFQPDFPVHPEYKRDSNSKS